MQWKTNSFTKYEYIMNFCCAINLKSRSNHVYLTVLFYMFRQSFLLPLWSLNCTTHLLIVEIHAHESLLSNFAIPWHWRIWTYKYYNDLLLGNFIHGVRGYTPRYTAVTILNLISNQYMQKILYSRLIFLKKKFILSIVLEKPMEQIYRIFTDLFTDALIDLDLVRSVMSNDYWKNCIEAWYRYMHQTFLILCSIRFHTQNLNSYNNIKN